MLTLVVFQREVHEAYQVLTTNLRKFRSYEAKVAEQLEAEQIDEGDH